MSGAHQIGLHGRAEQLKDVGLHAFNHFAFPMAKPNVLDHFSNIPVISPDHRHQMGEIGVFKEPAGQGGTQAHCERRILVDNFGGKTIVQADFRRLADGGETGPAEKPPVIRDSLPFGEAQVCLVLQRRPDQIGSIGNRAVSCKFRASVSKGVGVKVFDEIYVGRGKGNKPH